MRSPALAAMADPADNPEERSGVLSAARAGDLPAFELLMRQHQRLVLVTALRLSGICGAVFREAVMNCVEWETRVALHAGGDIAGAEAVEVERHLVECSACQLLWSGVRESLAVLQAAHAEAPAAAHFTAVRRRVMAELERSARPWRRLAWISGVAAVAALLLLATLWPVRVVPEAPRLLARIPPAPEVVKVAPVVRPAARQVVAHAPRRAPLTIKFQTADPNIVISWIAD